MNNETIVLALKKSMPTILTLCAGAGLVASNVLTAKATLKVDQIIRDEEFDRRTENYEPLTTKEKVKIAAPHYIPSVIAGSLSIACMIGSHQMDKKQIVAYASALGIADNFQRNYQKVITERYGKGVNEEIVEEVQRRPTVPDAAAKNVKHDGMLYFIDGITEEGFYADKETVNEAIYKVNRKLHLGNYVTLNSFRRDLGLKPTNFGSVVGWSTALDSIGRGESDDWVDFHLVPCETADWCVYISYLSMPHGLGISPREEKKIMETFKDKEYQSMWI